ncbi:MAG: 1-deoxy-D-xylulose-5-phosphate reductoisomerase, partial [Candidatus Eremiobacteraeota bacterium]|nr:1-deoxy-D-xylulose-5-phosphate reductoisomerase [Candidatus Eremiobacteraeota bacterium]
GGDVPAVLSAADESAVDLFLSGKIKFSQIPVLIEKVLSAHNVITRPTLSDILESDAWARKTTENFARELVDSF